MQLDKPRILLLDFYWPGRLTENYATVHFAITSTEAGVRGLQRVHEHDIIACVAHTGFSGGNLASFIPPWTWVETVRKAAWLIIFLGENHGRLPHLGITLHDVLPSDSMTFPYSHPDFAGFFERFERQVRPYISFGEGLYLTLRDRAQGLGAVTLLKDELGRSHSQLCQVGQGRVLLLPYFEDCTGALEWLLAYVLPKVAPELFPGRQEFAWLLENPYRFPAELAALRALEDLEAAYTARMEAARQVLSQAETDNAIFRALLVEKGEKLKEAVLRSLEFLGFGAKDLDKVVRSGRKGADLWLEDGAWVAVAEVSGTEAGPAEAHFAQLIKNLNRVMRQLKKTDINGLLILNYDIQTPAAEREQMYSSSPDTVQDAIEQKVSLVSSYQLFKLVQLVISGSLSQEQGRQLLKQPGLVRGPG